MSPTATMEASDAALLPAETPAAVTPRPARPGARRARYNRVMRWVRRIHLYTGLALVPWVFLYGFTGLLFNHPGMMSNTDRTAIVPAAFEGTAFAGRPDAEALAAHVVSALAGPLPTDPERDGDAAAAKEDEAPATDPTTYALVPGTARFDRRLAYEVRADDARHLVIQDLDDGAGELRTSPTEPERERVPFARRGGVAKDELPLDAYRDDVPRVLAALDIDEVGADAVRLRQAPRLAFEMDADGARWRVSYDLERRSVSATPTDRSEPISARSFMLRLHAAHGYPSRAGARTAWAVIVDVVSVVMLLWALSGILMWIQMKNVRWTGALALGAGLASAAALGWAMWAIFTGA